MVVGEMILETDILVIGAGPGGYTAAIHAADLGKDVVLVEARERLGGVCLTEGCIPSKTLIHAVGLAHEMNQAKSMGLVHDGISFDREKLLTHIQNTVQTLSSGVSSLVDNRDVEVVHGHARFKDEHTVYVDGANTIVHFNHAIIASGSSINELPRDLVTPDGPGTDSPRIWTSADALALPEIPESLLVIGGGYIGLEIGQAYAGLGSRVTLVESGKRIAAGADPDLIQVVVRECEKTFEALMTGSSVERIAQEGNGFNVTIKSSENKSIQHNFFRILAATGRHPNTRDLGLDTIGLGLDGNGTIITDDQCRTTIEHIFAVGDAAVGIPLAHNASRQGKVAVEVICGQPSAFDNVAVPAVLFTRPEIAWTGLTETAAKEKGIAVNVGKFPLTALGRARAANKTQGFVKILAKPDTGIILGVGIAGAHASDLIAEATLAIEMGATLEDLMVTIHPHPTFSESIMEAAETAASGSVHMMKKGKAK
nr:dihydrolipoyl dehydrogenase [uncultured Desulfobacter sp.]